MRFRVSNVCDVCCIHSIIFSSNTCCTPAFTSTTHVVHLLYVCCTPQHMMYACIHIYNTCCTPVVCMFYASTYVVRLHVNTYKHMLNACCSMMYASTHVVCLHSHQQHLLYACRTYVVRLNTCCTHLQHMLYACCTYVERLNTCCTPAFTSTTHVVRLLYVCCTPQHML